MCVVFSIAVSPASAGVIVDLTGNNTTADSSGNGNNGVWVGAPSYAPIASTTGFNLDGTNYVTVANGPSLAIPTSGIITYGATVDPNAYGLGTERIIDKITVGYDDGFLLDILNDQFRVIAANTALYSTNAVNAGTTYRLSVVYNGDLPTPTLSLYENGVLNTSATVGAFVNGANNRRIGADSNGNNIYNGVIANAYISTPIPEPATWAMMLVGFVGLGFVATRRRESAPLAI